MEWGLKKLVLEGGVLDHDDVSVKPTPSGIMLIGNGGVPDDTGVETHPSCTPGVWGAAIPQLGEQ